MPVVSPEGTAVSMTEENTAFAGVVLNKRLE
jgi:hypothetical protein